MKIDLRHYKMLVEQITDYAVFYLDPEGYIATWNKGAEKIKGYRPEEIIGKHFSIFYTPDALAEDFPAYELKVARADGRFEHEGWRVKKDGSLFWANVVITSLRETDGSHIGFFKVTRDLTERKNLEEELRQNEERYRLLVSDVKDYAIFFLDPHGFVSTWNAGAEKIKGYEPSEIIGKHFSIFYPPEAKERDFPAYELKVASEVGRFEDEGWRVKKDGSYFWANVIITAIRNDKGILLGFSKITRDLTERKNNEELLRQSESRFRMLIDSIKDYAVFMLDPEGYITTWNTGAENIKGYKADEVIGKHFSIFYPEEGILSGHPVHELEVASKEGRFEEEGWRVRKDGTRFLAHVTLNAIYDASGELVGYSKITRDVTEKSRIAELEQINEELRSIAYIMSHDLKTPIRSIGTLSDLVLRDSEELLHQKDKDYLKLIKDRAIWMDHLVNTFLKYSNAGKTRTVKEEFESSLVVRKVVASIPVPDFVQINISSDLPVLRSEETLIAEVFHCLLSNAVQHVRPPEGKVSVSAKERQFFWEYCVADNGSGIAPEHHKKIFELLQTLELKKNQNHMGVGLPIALKLVRLLGGAIWVESAEGLGAKFYFTIPK